MSSQQTVSVPVSSVPTHIVVWQEGNTIPSAPSVSSSAELVELRKRVEELEKMVRTLVSQPRYRSVADILSGRRLSSSEVSSIEQPTETLYQSPYFSATRVVEPVGLSVVTTPLHSASIAPHIPEIKIFDDIVEAAAAKKEKMVTLNGINFVCHTWNGETIYCQESTGRAFIDPKDAFNNPDEHSIGFWDPIHEQLEQKEKEDVKMVSLVTSSQEGGKEEEEADADAEEGGEEGGEEEVVEEEEEEGEEAMELEEIEYKGVTYYKDAQNQVYQMDEEGELDDTPIGVWNEQKQKVLKYR